MSRSYGFWSYSNMRLYLTYFPLFFNFLRKKSYFKREAYSLWIELKEKKPLTKSKGSATSEENRGF